MRANARSDPELEVPLSAFLSLAILALHPILVQEGRLPSPVNMIRYLHCSASPVHLFNIEQ